MLPAEPRRLSELFDHVAARFPDAQLAAVLAQRRPAAVLTDATGWARLTALRRALP